MTADGITFTGSSGLLEIADGSAVPSTTISGFGQSDTIDFAFLTSASSDSLSVSGDVVSVTAGGQTYV